MARGVGTGRADVSLLQSLRVGAMQYLRRGSCRRYRARMDFDSLGEWMKYAASGALGAVGVMIAGWTKFITDNKRIRVDDRSEFTKQLLARVAQLEDSLAQERIRCRAEIAELRGYYEARLQALESRMYKHEGSDGSGR